MPNITVPATAGGMPKFVRSAIMVDAWARYRRIRRQYGAWQIKRGIVDASFSACLKSAWRVAKQGRDEARQAAKSCRSDADIRRRSPSRSSSCAGKH